MISKQGLRKDDDLRHFTRACQHFPTLDNIWSHCPTCCGTHQKPYDHSHHDYGPPFWPFPITLKLELLGNSRPLDSQVIKPPKSSNKGSEMRCSCNNRLLGSASCCISFANPGERVWYLHGDHGGQRHHLEIFHTRQPLPQLHAHGLNNVDGILEQVKLRVSDQLPVGTLSALNGND